MERPLALRQIAHLFCSNSEQCEAISEIDPVVLMRGLANNSRMFPLAARKMSLVPIPKSNPNGTKFTTHGKQKFKLPEQNLTT